MLTTLRQMTREAGAVLREVRRGRLLVLADIVAYRLIGLGLLRASDRRRTVTMAGGSVLSYRCNRGDIQTLREVWLDRCYRLPRGVPTASVLDLGANIGLTSVWLAARYPVRRLIAVEPDPDNAELARVNLAVNGVAGGVIEAAVSPEPGITYLQRGRQPNTGRSHVGGGLPVPAVTPQELLGRLGGRVDLVKMDIEGAEERLLVSGDPSWLAHVGWVVAELHPGVIDRDEVLRRFELAGLARIAPGELWPGSMDMFRPASAPAGA
jgi:FkbM family methyltransferase